MTGQEQEQQDAQPANDFERRAQAAQSMNTPNGPQVIVTLFPGEDNISVPIIPGKTTRGEVYDQALGSLPEESRRKYTKVRVSGNDIPNFESARDELAKEGEIYSISTESRGNS